MRNIWLSCLTFIICLYGSLAKGQTTSNEGLDFWAVFPTHIPTSPTTLAKMSIYITSKNNSAGKVTVAGQILNFKVQANQIVEIPIPYEKAHINHSEVNKVVKNKGIHILVDPGEAKVAVFAFISASARSESYLVLPKEAMGQEYYAIGQEGHPVPTDEENGFRGEHYLIVTATEPNTNIVITKTDRTVITRNLPEAGDIFQLTSDQDFSGTKVESTGCAKFAAYSGHSGIAFAYATTALSSFDPLIQQLYPVASWGRSYGLIPFFNRNYFYKILAAQDGTEIRIDGILEAKLNAGQSYTPAMLPVTKPMILTSNNPVSVAQFAYVQEDLSAIAGKVALGDPDMVILNPEEYNIKTITLFASFDRTPEFYLNVFMKTSGKDSFKINGEPPGGQWMTLADPAYAYIQIPFNRYNLKQSSLTLTAEDGFNAMAYGFGEFESYAYSAGTNLAVSNYLTLTNLNANVTDVNGCVNEPLDVKVILPSRASRLTWNFEDDSFDFTEDRPSFKSIVNAEGVTQYEYTYSNGPIRYNQLGIHQISVIADIDPSTALCPEDIGLKTFTYNFEITAPDFTVPDTVEVLAGGSVKINGNPGIGNLSYRWSPSFGLSDAAVVNPVVTAEQTTNYTVTGYSDLGCSISKSVVVKVVDQVKIPNTFSPNGDGVNDVWNLKLLSTYEQARVEIFNRYGQLVFSNVGYSRQFDGFFEGKPLPVGTYYYVISPNNGRKNITGSITIIR